MKPEVLAENDERYVMGQWFESVAGAVKAYPMRAGAEPGRVIEYDRATVSQLAKEFNLVARSRNVPSGLEQAAASRHIYKINPATGWKGADAKGIDKAANDYKDGVEKNYGPSFASRYMQERMKRLYKICKLNRIGVSVTSSDAGTIQIDLIPQERPISKPVLRPPTMTFGK